MSFFTKLYSNIHFVPRCGTQTQVRKYLSDRYGAIGEISKREQNTDMPVVCLSLDRCHEKNFPISSLMIDRMVATIDNAEHLHGSQYYLHKFRYSENGYFLRPWTVYTFVDKCLKYDAQILMECLKNKQHYGIFPDQVCFNKLLDHFMKKNDLKGGVEVLVEMFLLEMLDNKTCHALSLKLLSQYWEANVAEGNVVPEFADVVEKRNIAGVLYCVGRFLSNPPIMVMGQALLGQIEAEHGIRAIYQEPWGPLSWEPGYLDTALNYLETSNSVISEECANTLLHCAGQQGSDCDTLVKVKEVINNLRERSLISSDETLTLNGAANKLLSCLKVNEEQDMNSFKQTAQDWVKERETLIEIESQILKEYSNERERVFQEMEIDDKAHLMAVERLGFWDLAKSEEADVSDQIFYLRKDYVEGAMYDLDILERYREICGSTKEPVILI
nr:28S ribosomal protein S27, mitochondrial [Ciona intestinalis]|eukprot:XP_002131841.2 28S ribosomal protein S27, mitochondrial [Ciona intestinalis]